MPKTDQRRARLADDLRKLSEAMGSLATRARWAVRDVKDDRAEDLRVGVAEAAELLFTLAQDIASGRVELDGPDSPRPLFDRAKAGGESLDPKPTPGTVAPAPPAPARPDPFDASGPGPIAALEGTPPEPGTTAPKNDYLVKCNGCDFVRRKSDAGSCPSHQLAGWSYAGPIVDEDTADMLRPGEHRYHVHLEDDDSDNPTFLGTLVAVSLARAVEIAPTWFWDNVVVPGTPLVVVPADAVHGEPWPFGTPLAECLTCGRRWPKAGPIGCPACVHALDEVAVEPPQYCWRDEHALELEVVSAQQYTDLSHEGIETVGQLWDALERGDLVGKATSFTVAKVKKIEAEIVCIRAEAGDPAPNTAPMEAPPKPSRKPPQKTFKLVYRTDDADEPIDCGEFKARDFDEARARIPELCRLESVRLASGSVVPTNLARVEVVQVPAVPRKRKEAVS
jgi:hypothetical protein